MAGDPVNDLWCSATSGRGDKIRWFFSTGPGSAPRPELACMKRVAYRISGILPAFRNIYNALSSDPKNRPLPMHFSPLANSL